MKKGVVIVSTAGVGKSTLARKYPNVLDLGPMDYSALMKDCEDNSSEKRKNIIYTNPEWPQNYINAIIAQREKYDVVLVAFLIELLEYPEFARLLRESKIEYRIAIPRITAVGEIIGRIIRRGNREEFARIIESTYPKIITEFSKDIYNSIIINDNEFIEDALIRENILKPII